MVRTRFTFHDLRSPSGSASASLGTARHGSGGREEFRCTGDASALSAQQPLAKVRPQPRCTRLASTWLGGSAAVRFAQSECQVSGIAIVGSIFPSPRRKTASGSIFATPGIRTARQRQKCPPHHLRSSAGPVRREATGSASGANCAGGWFITRYDLSNKAGTRIKAP